ncbi:HNH endonuclease signature motif containing protein [Yimella sp. NH-Cas1]|uniref:HNH endonuclease signature motif containing protein n=1 Tax=Yimella sp. NH-Cas1 TaxID=2917726 RepID=UPI001EFB9EFF|nr:HNH endonuclease signature motif containing protein [Yimella sp. NH-Cas1]MCG8654938.1 HNH endonuclease [Yimella sp. NH-Cas1]
MAISYEFYEPESPVEFVLLQSLSDQKQRLLNQLLNALGSPAEVLTFANRMSREAFYRLDAHAVRNAGSISTARPVDVDDHRMLEKAVTGSTQLASISQAVQAMAMARYAAIDEELVDSDTGVTAKVEHALGHQASFADTDVAAACQMAPRTASSKMSNSIDACTKTPGLLAAAVEGSVPYWKVSLVASELVSASPETSRRVEQHLLDTKGFDSWGYLKVKSAARALVTQWEEEAAKKTRQKEAKEATGVWVRPSDIPGMAELCAVGPADQIARIYGAVDQLADQRAKNPTASEGSEAGESKPTLGQLRLGALHDLVTQGADVSYQVAIQVPVVREEREEQAAAAATKRATDDPEHQPEASPDDGSPPPGQSATSPRGPNTTDQPTNTPSASGASGASGPESGSTARKSDHCYTTGWARIAGIGFIRPEVLDALIEQFGCRLTRALVDADTGVTCEISTTAYEPTSRMREFVQQRDQTCRFPMCTRAAIRCDIDHVVEWPQGPTAVQNLAALCRHHHDAKTKKHWDYDTSDDGVCTWTSRTGRTYITYPDSVHDAS